jgi:U3 small nucleolar ribonucleoprotein protein IMP3
VRIGTEVITDPAMLIGKNIEDHITWVDSSSIKKKIQNYKDQVDDYDLLN